MSFKHPNESPARAQAIPGFATKALPAAVAALTLSAICLFGAAPALASGTPPTEQQIGLLFTQTAPHGTFKPVKGKKGQFLLRLHNPPPQVVWFEDHPARHQGQIPIRGFAKAWKGYGFLSDPPNAALTLLNHKDSEDTVVVKLGKPRYHKRRDVIRYRARKLPHATGNLSDFESDNDGHVPRHFDDASLFIDDSTGVVWDGCVIAPYTQCPGLVWRNADLLNEIVNNANFAGAVFPFARMSGVFTNVDFTNADLQGATLQGDQTPYPGQPPFLVPSFANSDFTNADLTGATLDSPILTGANLRGAKLDHAVLYVHPGSEEPPYTNLTGANLTNASLTYAQLDFANFTNVNLTGADLTGATPWTTVRRSSGTIFCNTTMPDGSINDDDC
jgi:uncharacterized protein YjbI with pentapeptide repeats